MTSQNKFTSSSRRCTPNILPCCVHHNGPLKVSKRYWSPKAEADGTETAYFRGRKLRGRKVKLPKDYEGLFARSVERAASPSMSNDPPMSSNAELSGGKDGQAEPESVKVLEGIDAFDHLMVWGHEALPPTDDPFVKGVEEWIAFAEAVNLDPTSGGEAKT